MLYKSRDRLTSFQRDGFKNQRHTNVCWQSQTDEDQYVTIK